MELLSMFLIILPALVLCTSEYWGPGLRNILQSIAYRIRYGEPDTPPAKMGPTTTQSRGSK